MLFHRVKTLLLFLDAERSADWIEQLSSFVDLETVSQVKIDKAGQCDPGILEVDDVGQCLRRMPNLQSLIILCDVLSRVGFVSSSQPAIMPSSVRHLTLSIDSLGNCMFILERFDQLWTFMWHHRRKSIKDELETLGNWLDENRPGSSFKSVNFTLYIWLGQERMLLRVREGERKTLFSSLA